MIVVVDYGMGNSGSVQNMIRKVGGKVQVSNDPDTIAYADKLVLPGVGSFNAGIKALRETGIGDALRHAVKSRQVPLLGICLGMHLMLEYSDEGTLPGMAFVPGRVRLFQPKNKRIKVPHMGWNIVRSNNPNVLLEDGDKEQRYYFVHSYYVECTDATDVVGVTNYIHDFVSVFERENLMGTQFHPEKSHRFGMALFRRFDSMGSLC